MCVWFPALQEGVGRTYALKQMCESAAHSLKAPHLVEGFPWAGPWGETDVSLLSAVLIDAKLEKEASVPLSAGTGERPRPHTSPHSF